MSTDFQVSEPDPQDWCNGSTVLNSQGGKFIIRTNTMPPPEVLPNGTTYGYYSVHIPKEGKYVPYQYAKEIDGVFDTETSFTRQWIKSKGKRIIRRAEYNHYRATRAPLHVYPSVLDDAVYIDIVSAYPSIYKFLGWKTDYIRGRYWGVGENMPYPFPMSWKAGRSFVVSGARHMQYGRYVYNGKIKVKPYISQLSNPPLVAGVYDVLCMVARFARYALRSVYWNVDGGIMPRPAADILLPFLETIGLEGRIKYEGRATVLSSGYWKIGGHETLNYQSDKKGYLHSGDFNPVTKEEAEWIYKNFRAISERNK